MCIEPTYLRKNTQRHVVLSTMTPPRMGPRRLAIANTEVKMPVYKPILSGVMILVTMTKTFE